MAPVVAKWGNSLAVRLPMHVAKRSGITAGDRVDIASPEAGCVTVSLVRPKYSLKSLVDQITPDNLHGEADWGDPRGDEVW
ncbi:MAG: AbrB/MazE/SpoVT family DNA-binding domain-containing protein [Proteobacteria bacterium]|nr:AbrB/MazE/SpoVT family DNA-binding domain-containing protein [Pseudomonadota bacterium]MBU1449536.1 AbrB/MazE/SpoVT family DNA-binding domain-containing protein [Pseudomonadota bacterium]MBU2467017.1 AbrB/MazE/SpoVT family DNA-binding domain-containing protein [Pseudomonadota bacterium]